MSRIKAGDCLDGRYIIHSELGSGGMSTVYLALDKNLNRKVAVKVLLSGKNTITSERLSREAKAMCGLAHKNIVSVYHAGFINPESPYLALEYVEGETLRHLLVREKKLVPVRAINIALQICRGMAYAHQHQVIHRDLKPENIILTTEGKETIAKIVDFGLCKLQTGTENATLTETGIIVGTPAYMDPELVLGRPCTFSSDVYSFACVFFEMLCGEPPFRSENPAELYAMHVKERFPYVKAAKEPSGNEVMQNLNKILQKCAAKSASDRYENFAELVLALEEIENPDQLTSSLFAASPSPTAPSKRATIFLLAACALTCALLFGVYLGFTDPGRVRIAMLAQDFMSADQASRFLADYVSWNMKQNRQSTAWNVVQASLNSKMYQLWPFTQKCHLVESYIQVYRQEGLKEQSLELSYRLLANLLDKLRKLDFSKGKQEQVFKPLDKQVQTAVLIDVVTTPKHLKLQQTNQESEILLERLSQSLLSERLQNKDWKQLAVIFDLHDLPISSDYPTDPLWTGVLRIETLTHKYMENPTQRTYSLLAKLTFMTCKNMIVSKDEERGRLAQKYLERVLQCGKKFDFDYDLQYNTVHIGLLYLMLAKPDQAEKYLEAAKQFTHVEPNLIPDIKALEVGCQSKSYVESQKTLYREMYKKKTDED